MPLKMQLAMRTKGVYIYKPEAEAEQDVLLVAGSCQRAFLGVIVWP